MWIDLRHHVQLQPSNSASALGYLKTTRVASTGAMRMPNASFMRPRKRCTPPLASQPAPLQNLPSELLAFIFAVNEADRVSQFDKGIWTGSCLRASSQVCSHWRRAAFDHSYLWSASIDFGAESPIWISEMLVRSRKAPLDVKVNFKLIRDDDSRKRSNAQITQNVITALETASHRLRTLVVLLADETSLVSITSRLQRRSAPILETLTLTSTVSSSLIENDHHMTNLNNGEWIVPRLRSLKVRNCWLTWKSSGLRNLTNLDISTFSMRARPTLDEVLDVLQHNASLETLFLCKILPRHSPSSRVVDLPHLSRLELTGEAQELVGIMRSLMYSYKTQTKVSCQADLSSEEEILLLARTFGLKHEQSIMETLFITSSMFGFRTSCWKTSVDDCLQGPPPNFSISFHWTTHSYRDSVMQHNISALCDRLAVSTTKNLVIGIPQEAEFQPTFWDLPLTTMQHVTTLQVIGGPPASLFHCLASDATVAASLLPRLQRVELWMSDLTSSRHPETFRSVIDFARSRVLPAHSGSSTGFTFRSCRATEHTMAALRGCGECREPVSLRVDVVLPKSS